MNKILNVPEDFVSETLEGILLASNQKLLSMDKDNRVIVSNYPCKPNKVGIVTAGGSGHLPTFLGYVGKGIPYMLKNILEYINSNYQNSSLTLSSIAERFWVNPSYLSRYFKTYMGINIVQYIRSMRIFYAKSLLQSSDMSIAEVAEMVGIKSASHFSKIFENEVGESPSKFRKSYFDRNHS